MRLEGKNPFLQVSSARNFSIVGLKLTLENRHSKYLWVYFLPTSMFTITSWVSFILPPTSYPARTSLLVTVLLCQTGIFNAVIRDTPKHRKVDINLKSPTSPFAPHFGPKRKKGERGLLPLQRKTSLSCFPPFPPQKFLRDKISWV